MNQNILIMKPIAMTHIDLYIPPCRPTAYFELTCAIGGDVGEMYAKGDSSGAFVRNVFSVSVLGVD